MINCDKILIIKNLGKEINDSLGVLPAQYSIMGIQFLSHLSF